MKLPSLSSPAAVRLFVAAILAASASPALAATPFKMRIPVGPIVAAAPAPDISIAGYNPLTGMLQSPSGSFTWDGTAYTVPSGTAFGITGPVTLTLAMAGAGAKAAIRTNPAGVSGTAAEGWLTASGVQLTTDGLGFESVPAYGGGVLRIATTRGTTRMAGQRAEMWPRG